MFEVQYLFQVGKNKKTFKTEWSFKQDELEQAVAHYKAHQLVKGTKKRLLMRAVLMTDRVPHDLHLNSEESNEQYIQGSINED